MDLSVVYILAYVLMLLVVGYMLPFLNKRKIATMSAWVLAVVTVMVSVLVTWKSSPLLTMVLIVSLQLVSMKVVVAVETYNGDNGLSWFQWLAFSLGWFGMRPGLFEKLPSTALAYDTLLIKGLSRILIGYVFLLISAALERHESLHDFFLPQVSLLIGLSLMLHFGVLNLSAAFWRSSGVDVTELFRSPYRSKSLKEFWGARWNIAFSEMTALVAYRPLKRRLGVENAITVSFLFSGLLHEVAISIPARSGYGLPLLYFGIHALAMHLERKSFFVQKIIAHNFFSRIWVMTLLILPMPILFHERFIAEVLVPLRDVILGVCVQCKLTTVMPLT